VFCIVLADCINYLALNFTPERVAYAVRFVQNLVNHIFAAFAEMLSHLRPHRKQNFVNIASGVFGGIKRVVVNNNVNFIFFRPVNRLVKKTQQHRVKYIIGAGACHVVHTYRKPDYVNSQALYIGKILFRVLCKNNSFG